MEKFQNNKCSYIDATIFMLISNWNNNYSYIDRKISE